MALPEVHMCFPDLPAAEKELDTNLRHGRAFIVDAGGVQVLSDCELVLTVEGTDGELRLSAHAVMVSESGAMVGVGVELRPFDDGVMASLEAFARGEMPTPAAPAVDEPDDSGNDRQTIEDFKKEFEDDADEEDEGEEDEGEEDEGESEDSGAEQLPDDGLEGDPDQPVEPSTPPTNAEVQAVSQQERIRRLSQVEQHKMARTGELSDRVILERMYGKNVWESLLRNPRLTVPEVARLARKGTVPRPLLEIIVENSGWSKAPPVRRALLQNTRLASDAVMKLLRLTPKHELKNIVKGTSYSMPVRDAAKKLL